MLSSLVLSVTYQCPIKCRYCGVNGGPHHRERMSLDFIKRMVDEAVDLGTVAIVVFTGGEPLLLGRDLYEAVEYATGKGLMTRIVTNAYWASTLEWARSVAGELQRRGLTEINFSCDDFHQEHIPLEYVKNADLACVELGIPVLIACKGIRNSVITPEYVEQAFGIKLARFRHEDGNPSGNAISYGITVPVGWEAESLSDNDLLWPDSPACWQGPCDSILRTIVITPTGDMAVCCGIGSEEIPETKIGSTSGTHLANLIVEANNDLIANWLALQGPYGIMRFVQERSPEIAFHSEYVNMCHLCHDIFTRKEVRDLLTERIDEAVPILSLHRAWLEAHRPVPGPDGAQANRVPADEAPAMT